MSAIECDCGDCRTCRRAMGLVTATTTVTLSESTRRILANLDTPRDSEPAPRKTAPKKVIHRREPTHRNGYCRKDLHKMEGDNVRETVRSNGRIVRECRECVRERNRKPQAQPVEVVVHVPTLIACIECGGETDTRRATDGKCEVCADRPKHLRTLEEFDNLRGVQREKRGAAARRARNMLRRTLKDGRAFAADAPHGTSSGYVHHGCRCVSCAEWKASSKRVLVA